MEERYTTERRSQARQDADRRAHHDAIFTLARAAERHDEATGNHVIRIRLVVEQIASAIGIADAEDLGYDAMLHDVGKLYIAPEILRKPGRLDDTERRTMESHTLLGEQLLAGPASMVRAARIARSHHECWDASGYPDGLAGAAIPLEARITAAADVLDALLSDRGYKKAWSYRDAVDAVCDLAGTKLDPAVVDALRKCDDEGVLEPIYS